MLGYFEPGSQTKEKHRTFEDAPRLQAFLAHTDSNKIWTLLMMRKFQDAKLKEHPVEEGDMILRNVCTYPPNYRASRPSRPESSATRGTRGQNCTLLSVNLASAVSINVPTARKLLQCASQNPPTDNGNSAAALHRMHADEEPCCQLSTKFVVVVSVGYGNSMAVRMHFRPIACVCICICHGGGNIKNGFETNS